MYVEIRVGFLIENTFTYYIVVLTYLKYLEMRSMDFKTDTYYTSRALIICSLFNQYYQFIINVTQYPKSLNRRGHGENTRVCFPHQRKKFKNVDSWQLNL